MAKAPLNRTPLMTPLAAFEDLHTTAKGERRAWVDLKALSTLWFNTGTLCNLTCANCYIESSPKNDALVYITQAEVVSFLDEIQTQALPTHEIGLTGGEPFMNPEILAIIEAVLSRGFECLVLTNAMRPMMKCAEGLLALNERYPHHLTLRVSVDHFDAALHEEERGPRTWKPTILGLEWLAKNGFQLDVAGRTRWGEDEATLRAGFARLFEEHGIELDANDPQKLVLFPEMDEKAPVPEITTECWSILGVSPNDVMCASSRMVVKHKGDDKPSVMACTLLAYDPRFNLGTTLQDAAKSVHLAHPHCAKFCVLGGGSCSVSD
jgi:uncharacterized Fe-S cluster-containing radical SAM superfamily protein